MRQSTSSPPDPPSAAQAGSAASRQAATSANADGARPKSKAGRRVRGPKDIHRPAGKPRWSQRHESFAQSYAVSGNASEAWRQATGKKRNANVNGPCYLAKVGMAERIAEIRAENAKLAKRSKDDLQTFLWKAVDLRGYATPEQLRASEILNRMNGWNDPEKHEVGVGVVVTIGGDAGDD